MVELLPHKKNKIVDHPNFAYEKVYQDAPAGCERWWKSFNGVNPYWDIITGAPCGNETYQDTGWDFWLLKATP